MEIEIWLPVKGYEKYEVSSLARIRKVATKRLIKQRIEHGRRYMIVMLGAGRTGKTHTKRVHRLVAEAHLPKIPGKNFVNHKDGDRWNNHKSNLEWSTRKENNHHQYFVLGHRNLKAPKVPWNKRHTEETLQQAWRLHKQGVTGGKIGDLLGFEESTVNRWLQKLRLNPPCDSVAPCPG
jgi:hypothetical protein